MKQIDAKLYIIHSIIVRLKGTDENANGYCFTCGEKITYFTGECGHFPYATRGNKKFAWDITIARIQCTHCNRELQGNPEPFRDRLINELGYECVSRVEFESKKPFKWFISDKYGLFKELKEEAKLLLMDKNFNVQLP